MDQAEVDAILSQADTGSGNAHASHYMTQVARAGDGRSVLAAEDILSETGMNLLARGKSLNSDILHRLVQHKLLKPIDESITIADAIGPEEVRRIAESVISQSPLCVALIREAQREHIVHQAFSSLSLSTAIRNKLTVMHEIAPALLEHSVATALLCTFLADQLGQPEQQIANLALAGLLHDVGHMHTDPGLLDRSRRADAQLRRQVRVHPIIGYAILRKIAFMPAAVARAVLEHHERLDGSGYPDGSVEKQISLPGRILCFAEFSQGVASHAGIEHLCNIMKTYTEQFERSAIRAFWQHVDRKVGGGYYPFDISSTPYMMRTLRESEKAWGKLRATGLPQIWSSIPISYSAVHHALSSAGVAQVDMEAIGLAGGYDEELDMTEICSVLVEGLRQVNETCRQVEAYSERDNIEARHPRLWRWLVDTIEATELQQFRVSDDAADADGQSSDPGNAVEPQ